MTPDDIRKLAADTDHCSPTKWAEVLRALADVVEATKQILAHCDTSSEGETGFEQAVIAARAAVARVEALKP